MNTDALYALIPITGMLVVFGFPVAIVFVLKYFKLKERELATSVEAGQRSQQQQLAIEQRVRRLEEVLLNLDHDVRARLGIGQSGTSRDSRPDLLEAPASMREQGPGGPPEAAREKER
ncbi:MAG TPA: hypothetical protein VG496_04030 [Myxococcales bacterium]|nr:hypothetical protein [Myxococcales bacterium]